MGINSIITSRLIIMPMSKKIAKAVLSGEDDDLNELGIKKYATWPREDTLDILNFIFENMPEHYVSGFDVWMIIKKEDMMIIGDAGFRGIPNEDGEVEIGFGLVDDEHGKGYGYETASALINWAFTQNGVDIVKAECLIDNYGSIGVLRKCGMKEIRRDDEIIFWEIKKATA